MINSTILPVVFLLLTMVQLNAQDLSFHRWENRLLLVLADDPDLLIFKQQMQQLQSEKPGHDERKLLIYQATPKKYRAGTGMSHNWKNSGKLYSRYKKTDAPFEILLIGLDGGIKLCQTAKLSCAELFATIDVMPMRQAEMSRKHN